MSSRNISWLRALPLLAPIASVLFFAAPPARTFAAPAHPRADLARFRKRVEAALADARAQKAYWGVLVEDARTGETLYELNAGRTFVPASNAKIFTAALALQALGPDYRFRTTIETRGTLDDAGRLHGDLLLVGRGDPDLSNRKFPYVGKVERDGPADKILEEMADAVVAKGVKEIDGAIVGDDTYYPFDPYPAGWTVGDLYFSFGAPVSAIALNDNTLAIEVRPGEQVGAPAQLDIEPSDGRIGPGYRIVTGAADSKVQFEVIRQPGPVSTLLRGSIPLGHEPVKLDLAMSEPAEYAARVLQRLLESRGVQVTGEARAEHALPPLAPAAPATIAIPVPAPAAAAPPADPSKNSLVLAEHLSLPLIESVRLLDKVSQNLHAELLLRAVAREKTGTGSLDAGLKAEQEFLKSIGIAEGDVTLVDGSGLSRGNLVTPRATAALLRWAAEQPWGEAFLSTLPVSGQDGTLESRMKNTPAAGRIQAKTGALEHDRAMSGFATTLHGERLVFAMFGNNHPQAGHDATSVFDAIAIAMVEEIGSASRAAPLKRKK